MKIPEQLKSIKNWSTHTNKVPNFYRDKKGNSILKKFSFQEANKILKTLPKNSGLSFDFAGTNFNYVDLDTYKKRADKELHKNILKKAINETYVEISQSGKGHHILFSGKRLKGIKAVDSRDKNLLYITGNSIGKDKINSPSKKFINIYKKGINKKGNEKHELRNKKLDRIRKIIKHIEPDIRKIWIKVGQAIHFESNGTEEGLQIWDSWSGLTTSGNYVDGECKKKWKGFKSDKKEDSVTIATLVHLSKKGENKGKNKEKLKPKKFVKLFEVTDVDIKENQNSRLLYKGISVENQLTVIVAPPNAGKSAIMFYKVSPDLAKSGKKVLYIDVDSATSDRSLMFNFAKKHQFSFINPDAKKGKSISLLIDKLETLSQGDNDLREYVFIIDTLKKFNDMMSKSETKKTFTLFKGLVAQGATVIVMAHSNKFADKDENWIYEGTNDIVSEPDALIYLYFKKNKKNKNVILTSYPFKERTEIGQATFKIKGGKRDSTNLNSLVKLKKKIIDVKMLGKIYKEPKQKSQTVDTIKAEIKKHLNKKDWLSRIGLTKKTEGSISRNKLWAFLNEFSQKNDKQIFIVKRGAKNSLYYKLK